MFCNYYPIKKNRDHFLQWTSIGITGIQGLSFIHLKNVDLLYEDYSWYRLCTRSCTMATKFIVKKNRSREHAWLKSCHFKNGYGHPPNPSYPIFLINRLILLTEKWFSLLINKNWLVATLTVRYEWADIDKTGSILPTFQN